MGNKVKIGGWEIPEKQVAEWFNDGKYAVTYSKVFQIFYSAAQRCYYGVAVLNKPLRSGVGFAKRGEVLAMTASEINALLGVKVLATT